MWERTIAREIKYAGKIITVRVDKVELPDGRTASREVVEHPGAAAVLAVNKAKEAYFVRQFRKAVEKELLEIPAGKLEAGEAPHICAARELAEEVGMAAGDLRLLATFYSSPGFTAEKLYVYLATGLHPVSPSAEEDEFLEPVRLPLAEAVRMARTGEIVDAKTLIALLLAADLGLAT